MNADLIIISQTPWHGNYKKSTVELAKAVSRHHRVFFVNYPFTLKDLLTGQRLRLKQVWRIIWGIVEYPTKNKNLILIPCTPYIPINWISSAAIHDFFLRINVFFLDIRLNRILRKHKVKKAQWLAAMSPATSGVLQRYWSNERFWYYAYDQIAAAKYMKSHGTRWESKFLPSAYGVICSSKALLEEKSYLNTNVFLVENGVDYDQFSHYCVHSKSREAKINVLYVGAIDDRIDSDWVEFAIQSDWEMEFKFVGPVHDQKVANSLRRLPRTSLHSPVSSSDLGKIMAQADVGIIPFRKTNFTRYIYPMKVNEYLSVGLPVVSSDFADFGHLSKAIYIVNTKEDFLKSLKTSALQKSPTEIALRKSFAQKNSWSSRGHLLLQTLNQKI